MLKAIEKLVSGKAKRVGNHSVENSVAERFERYIYHETCICAVDHEEKTFRLRNGGWNTQSTNRAINDYRRYFLSKGYKQIVKNKGDVKVA